MNGRLVDTNILISLAKNEIELADIATDETRLYISVITYMETMSYRFQNSIEKETVSKLCEKLPVIQLSRKIVEKVITLKENPEINLGDAVIAATAITNRLDLVTANVSDYQNLDSKLKLFNPFENK
ncbi:MAG TPA: type II toxin-antitoxin system VapC family toxin [Tangfeifania sp.]|nr:type II toxin-antitoxin system VapC family toxin [Tangfeifania sp.]